jgi:hypothetical protein
MGSGTIPLVVAIVVPLVLSGLVSAGARSRPALGQLCYPPAWRWFSLAMTILPPIFFASLALLQQRPLAPKDVASLLGVILFILAIAMPLLLEVVRVRHVFDEAGLSFHSPWSRDRSLRWSSVSSLEWRSVIKWLDLRTSDGVTVHISPALSGLEAFAERALASLPPEVLAAASRQARLVLQVMAAGKAGALMTSAQTLDQIAATIGR